jgi:hypothetical protein
MASIKVKLINSTISKLYANYLCISLGLAPTIARETFYTSLRLSLYHPIIKQLQSYDPHDLIIPTHFLAGFLSGSSACMCAHPLDTIKIRIMSESGYSSILQAIRRASLLNGLSCNMLRAGIVNGVFFHYYEDILDRTDLPIESLTRIYYPRAGWDIFGYLATVVEAGLYCSVLATPLDIMRTRLMRQQQIAGLVMDQPLKLSMFYSSAADVGLHLYAMGDGFYLGFMRNWIRYSCMFGLQVALYHYLVRPQCRGLINYARS